jgi:hypothetical protein
MKSISCLFILFPLILFSQTISNVKFNSGNYAFKEIVSLTSFSDLGISSGSKTAAVNIINHNSSLGEILLFTFKDENAVANPVNIYSDTSSLKAKKILYTTPESLFILAESITPDSSTSLLLIQYNIKLNSISRVDELNKTMDPEFKMNAVDVIYAARNFYILAKAKVKNIDVSNDKIIIIKYNGSNVVWSKIYNVKNPIHSEQAASITLDPVGNLLVSGTIIRDSDPEPRLLLAQFDTMGQPVLMKSAELLFPDLKHNNRFAWTSVITKGANIYLFSQALVGADEPGTILFTWFDIYLQLRTWRNYTGSIRINSVNSDGNFFLLGGQAPIETANDGYSLMKVNSSNAIVEQFKNYKTGLHNVSNSNTSQSIYSRAEDKFWTLTIPNGYPENPMVLIKNNGVLDHPCSDEFTSTVAKDTMRVKSLPVDAESLELSSLNGDLKIKTTGLNITELCNRTAVKESNQLAVNVYPNPSAGTWNIESSQLISKIYIINNLSDCLYTIPVNFYKGSIHCELLPGIYTMKILLKTQEFKTIKVVVL